MSTPPAKPPEILDKIVEVVLAHRPKPAAKAAKKRRQQGGMKRVSSQPPTKKKSRTAREVPTNAARINDGLLLPRRL